MDAIERARQKSYKRMLAMGLSEDVAARKAGLIEDATPQDITPIDIQPQDVSPPDIRPERKEKKGKVMVEVLVYLEDEPMTFTYLTDMRGALLKTQLNRKFLGEKFSEFLRSLLGRVDDISRKH